MTTMTTAEVAALFGVTVTTVNRWAQSGKLPSTRTFGGHRRFDRAAVEAAWQTTQEPATT